MLSSTLQGRFKTDDINGKRLGLETGPDLSPLLKLDVIELTVVAPCFNEKDNIPRLVEKLELALRGIEWEVLFVDDDSPDGSADVARAISRSNPRVRCLQRLRRRGLSTAVIEGILASSAPYIAVIDADLQHDENLLSAMLEKIKSEDLDIVIGSRYLAEGGVADWDTRRVAISNLACRVAQRLIRTQLTDPMSGFFVVTRSAFEVAMRDLSGRGFKILLDIMLSASRPLRYLELPYQFKSRSFGESKLDSNAVIQYFLLLAEKSMGKLIPIEFLIFACIGVTGVAVHLGILKLSMLFLSFTGSQVLATLVAMTSNFFGNNYLTYRDKRLKGIRLLYGLLSFYAICGFGAITNVGVASIAFTQHYSWWLSALAGISISVVWNYAVSSALTWK